MKNGDKVKLYFEDSEDAEFCASLDWWKSWMQENGFDSIALVEAKKVKDSEYFFCKKHHAVGEKGYCGKVCDSYKPRNGKSGICQHYGYCYETTENKILIKL